MGVFNPGGAVGWCRPIVPPSFHRLLCFIVTAPCAFFLPTNHFCLLMGWIQSNPGRKIDSIDQGGLLWTTGVEIVVSTEYDTSPPVKLGRCRPWHRVIDVKNDVRMPFDAMFATVTSGTIIAFQIGRRSLHPGSAVSKSTLVLDHEVVQFPLSAGD